MQFGKLAERQARNGLFDCIKSGALSNPTPLPTAYVSESLSHSAALPVSSHDAFS